MLETDYQFSTPIYSIQKPEWLSNITKLTDEYLKNAFEDKIGKTHYKSLLVNDPKLKEVENFIGQTSIELLDTWGYDTKNYTMFFDEFWVQEFFKNGGGHHSTHVHWGNHISGFYFIKCSEKTSHPIFHDPRAGAMMTKLPQKDKSKINIMSDAVHYKPKPGTLMFFPSYLPHEFVVDDGVEPFRFIHFNLQAVKNRGNEIEQ